MEGLSASMYKGVRNYWEKKGYQRINGSGRRRRNRVELARMGGNRRKRFWRIKINPKMSLFKFLSPKKFFVRLRDAYVNMMLGFANSRVCSSGYGGAITGFGNGYGRGPLKEYDERYIVELYKSVVVAQGQLVPCDAAKLGSQVHWRG